MIARVYPVLGLCLLVFVAFGLRTTPLSAQDLTGLQAAQIMEKAMVDAIAEAEKSVVAIARVRKNQGQARVDEFDLQRQLLDPNQLALDDPGPTDPDFIPREFGTGVIIDAKGYVVTNYHVLGDPKENDYYVWVNRRVVKVSSVQPKAVRAGDPWTDLAVLKIDLDGLTPIKLGDASKLKKGMVVIALGNPYAIARDGEPSASWGIISNLARAAAPNPRPERAELAKETLHHYGTLIQTDARLNLGTSGGALINLRGEMVGLTTALAALSGYETSAGFAIPVDDVFRRAVNELKAGRVPEFGFLGVQPEHLTEDERRNGRFGARVLRVIEGTPAAQAGIKDGDIITHVDHVPIADKNVLFRELSKRAVGAKVQITVLRFDVGRQRRRDNVLEAVLSKKFVDSSRVAFAQTEPQEWRGMRVEYATALPPVMLRQSGSLVDADGCVGVLEVERDSPAWKAGLRAGLFVSHVENRRVVNPQQFYSAVSGVQGEVRLHLTTGRGQDAIRIVAH